MVTGGAGFIGSNIVKRLLEQGHEAVVLDDISSGFRENLVPGVPFREADVRDGEAVAAALRGCDVALHLAASVGNARSIDDPVKDAQINVIGTLNVLQAARRHGLRRVVFSSSAGIFGELKMLPIAEDHPQDPDSPYGASKLAAEKMCLVFNKLYGMCNVCLRYFNVYGVNQRYDAYGNVIPIFADRILRGVPLTIFGDGEQTRDFVNARDVGRRQHRGGDGRRRRPGLVQRGQLDASHDQRPGGHDAARGRPAGRRRAALRRARATCATASPLPEAARAAFGFVPQRRARRGARRVHGLDARDPVTQRRLVEAAT